MSRIANKPIKIPANIKLELEGNSLTIQGKNGSVFFRLASGLSYEINNGHLILIYDKLDKSLSISAGTAASNLRNIFHGIEHGFEKKLILVGVGYRAQLINNKINLSLGYSHPVEYILPDSVTAESQNQTEIILRSSNKELLGKVAADIRNLRPPEPYKGKGVRYSDENIIKKEAKKK